MKKENLGRRLLQIVIVLFGISFFTFGLTYLSPGDPAEIMLTECGNIPTPELLEQTRAELGLDKPFLVQYGNWLKGVLTGDMGKSYSMKVPVVEKLVSCFFPTLKLALASLLIMILFSIPLGILSAVYHNRWPDYLVRGLTFFGVSVPNFWIGLILLSIFGVQLRWVTVSGGCYPGHCHVCQIHQTGADCRAGRAAAGLRYRGSYEGDFREKDFVETCASQCYASSGNAFGAFPGQSAGRNGSGGNYL